MLRLGHSLAEPPSLHRLLSLRLDLVRRLAGTMVSPTSRAQCIIGVRPWTFRCGLICSLPDRHEIPGFRSRCCVHSQGLRTAPGPQASRNTGRFQFRLRLVQQRRHPGVATAGAMVFNFAAPYLACNVPCQRSPRIGHEVHDSEPGGALLLHCMKLSFTTPYRFYRRI